jgi:secondary thiamine-phosphate synthase enzyme
MIEFKITTRSREEFIDITEEVVSKVESLTKEKNMEEGIAVIYVPHTTAGILINENADPSVRKDIIEFLQKNIPKDKNYHHLEGNSDSHIKASIIGNSLNLIISKGKVILGSWQGIFFCEFDGPRSRKIYIQITKSL